MVAEDELLSHQSGGDFADVIVVGELRRAEG